MRAGAARNVSRQELEEVYEARRVLEGFAASQAARLIGPDELRQLAFAVDEMRAVARAAAWRILTRDMQTPGPGPLPAADGQLPADEDPLIARWLAAEYGFHGMIAQAAQNRRLVAVIRELISLTLETAADQPIRYMSPVRALARTYWQHRRILRALRRRDPEAAEREMRSHLETAQHLGLAGWDLNAKRRARGRDAAEGFLGSLRRLFRT
jgi:DNA-binding GntR family transcriptional regulator